MKLEGTYTALITPFRTAKGGGAPAVDLDAFRKFVEWQIGCGVSGIVVGGTSAEAATLDPEERTVLVETAIKQVDKRVPVIVGTGSNNTVATIEATRLACELGADAALVVTPYYNRPSQEGLYRHFSAVARDGGLPVVLYNVPTRTAVDLLPETVRRLAEVDGIIGIKEATVSGARFLELGAMARPDFSVLSGEDSVICFAMLAGAAGTISASANVIPQEIHEIVQVALAGDHAGAALAQHRAHSMISALFAETNPVPAKAALEIMGIIPEGAVRLPLVEAGEATRALLRAALEDVGATAKRKAVKGG